MKLLLSLDYELFFGADVGTVRGCLIDPTEAIRAAVQTSGVRLVVFADATFLLRLREQARRFPSLQRDFDLIRSQLSRMVDDGHDVQLHVHPHWMDSAFDGENWRLSTRRYRLHDFAPADRQVIVRSSKVVLEEIVGRPVFAFRAGGWCLQPFAEIAAALSDAGVWLDSTVYAEGRSDDPGREHDFRGAPLKSHWRFGADPAREDNEGGFVEVPISSFRASPLLFWRMVAGRRSRGSHRVSGEGSPMSHGPGYYARRLLLPSRSVASIDGMKAQALVSALRQSRRQGAGELFHVMGHPKALTPFSLDCLRRFLAGIGAVESVTMTDHAHLAPAASA